MILSLIADDTIWFWEGLLRLLEQFDHNTPYIITGNAFNRSQEAFGTLDTFILLSGGQHQLFLTFQNICCEDGAYWHNWGRGAAPRFEEDGPLRCLPCHFNQSGNSLCLLLTMLLTGVISVLSADMLC